MLTCHCILRIAGLIVRRCRGLKVILVDAPARSVLHGRLDDNFVRLTCEAFRLRANQRWRYNLALTVLKAENVAFW